MLKEQKKQDGLKVLFEGQEPEAVQSCCTTAATSKVR
jgi:hypothetical protein